MMSYRLSLQILSVLLTYPRTTGWAEALRDLQALAQEDNLPEILPAVQALLVQEEALLQRLYVETFDFSEATCLYLTAHEWGDRSERGEALVALGNLLDEAGMHPVEGELPDYLPALMEFLAQAPAEMDLQLLTTRLGTVCHKISDHLDEQNPYRFVFEYACQILPCAAIEDTQTRQPADLDDLPYPLIYD